MPELVVIAGLTSLLSACLGLCALNYSSHLILSVYGACCGLYVVLMIVGLPGSWTVKADKIADGGLVLNTMYFTLIFILTILATFAFAFSYHLRFQEQQRRKSLQCTCEASSPLQAIGSNTNQIQDMATVNVPKPNSHTMMPDGNSRNFMGYLCSARAHQQPTEYAHTTSQISNNLINNDLTNDLPNLANQSSMKLGKQRHNVPSFSRSNYHMTPNHHDAEHHNDNQETQSIATIHSSANHLHHLDNSHCNHNQNQMRAFTSNFNVNQAVGKPHRPTDYGNTNNITSSNCLQHHALATIPRRGFPPKTRKNGKRFCSPSVAAVTAAAAAAFLGGVADGGAWMNGSGDNGGVDGLDDIGTMGSDCEFDHPGHGAENARFEIA